jgi:hypothetical protein
MLITAKHSIRNKGKSYKAGSTFEVSTRLATRLIERGFAEPGRGPVRVSAETPETTEELLKKLGQPNTKGAQVVGGKGKGHPKPAPRGNKVG